MTAGGVNAIRKRAVCRPFGNGNLRFDGEAYSLLAMEWWLSPGLRSCLDGAPWSRVALKIS